jgi:ion channel
MRESLPGSTANELSPRGQVIGCIFWGIVGVIAIWVWFFQHQWLDNLNNRWEALWRPLIDLTVGDVLQPPLQFVGKELLQLANWLASDLFRLELIAFPTAVVFILLPKPKSWKNDWTVIIGALVLVASAGIVWYAALEQPLRGIAGLDTYSFVIYGMASLALYTITFIGALTFRWLNRVGTSLAMAFLGAVWVFYVTYLAYFYLALSAAGTSAFNEGKLAPEDALYLAVTTFTTIGSGNLQPMHHSVRLLVASQTTLDFVIIAAAVAIVLNWYTGRQSMAMQQGVEEDKRKDVDRIKTALAEYELRKEALAPKSEDSLPQEVGQTRSLPIRPERL